MTRGGLAAFAEVVPANATIDQAQALIEQHLDCDLAGRCPTCGDMAPCRWRALAYAVFISNGDALPRKRATYRLADSATYPGFVEPGSRTPAASG